MPFPTLIVEVAFSASAASSGAGYLYLDDPARGKLGTGTLAGDIWADITPYVVGTMTVERGSQRFDGTLIRYEPGRLTLTLDNRDRRFDPLNISGPYAVAGVSQVTPMRAVRVRASYGSNLVANASFEADTFGWSPNANTTISRTVGQASDGGASMTLTATAAGNVSAFTYRSPVTAGQTYTAMASFRAVTAARTVRVDLDWYDSGGNYLSTSTAATVITSTSEWRTATGNVVAPAGAASAAPVVWILSAAAGGEAHRVDQVGLFAGASQTWTPPPTAYPLFRGFADEWALSWDGPEGATCTLRATDATKVLASYDGPAQTAQGGGEDAGARVSRILNNVGWSASDRVIDVGDTLLQSTTLDAPAGTELQTTADSEGGEVFVDASGRVVFRRRRSTLTRAGSTLSQGVFGDADAEPPYEDVELSYDDAQLRNYITVTRTGGSDQVAQDSASQAAYLTRTWAASGLVMQTDADALNLAQMVLYQSKDPELRFAAVKIRPQSDPDRLFPQVLARDFGDRITIRRRPPGSYTVTYDDPNYSYDGAWTYDGGTLMQRDVFIRGVRHEIGPLSWTTTWALQSTSKQAWIVLDDPILAVLGSSALAY